MRVTREAMQKIFDLHREAEIAARRRDDAVALVLATLGAPLDARIELQEDGTGLVAIPDVGKPDNEKGML